MLSSIIHLYWHITLKHPLYTHSMCLPFLVHSRLGFEHSTLTLSRIPIFLFVSFFARALTIALNVPTLRLYLSLSLYVVSHGYTTRVHPPAVLGTKSGSETATPVLPSATVSGFLLSVFLTHRLLLPPPLHSHLN